jgi:F-type H+-transporting ATPase subunit delta
MHPSKQSQRLARQLYRLSLVEGQISAAQVDGVLAYLAAHPPRQWLAVLKHYRRLVVRQLARNHALVEHAGAINDALLRGIAEALARKCQRPVTAAAQPNPALIAGLRIRLGDDIYESSIAGQLAALASAG